MESIKRARLYIASCVFWWGNVGPRATVRNIDVKTVEGFGAEWTWFDQSQVSHEELLDAFQQYFKVFPWDALAQGAVGFDMGCGSGRWAKLVAPKVGRLYCIDASRAALEVAKKNLRPFDNCRFLVASVDHLPVQDNSMDFGYSLGVLHHVPDTASGIRSCVNKLKPRAPFLLYLYYALENRPTWFRLAWKISNVGRRFLSKLPFGLRYVTTQIIALLVYYPLAKTSSILELMGFKVDSFPLSAYRRRSFYCMRTDALDRFGTRLEKRFTSSEIRKMMEDAGLERIQFSGSVPYWCAVGYKKSPIPSVATGFGSPRLGATQPPT